MTESSTHIKDLFLDKPERVIDFAEPALSELRNIPGLAIVEMAGRDSVAAAIISSQEKGFTDLLPTYVYTGTEYGSWASVLKAVERLEQKLSPKVRIHDLLVFGSPEFWRALNGRFINRLIEKFEFYTPCIGCHLYLHVTRIPLAVMLGNKPVIAGERESHDGRTKINQVSAALDAYEDFFSSYDVPLLMPLRHIEDGARIEEILGFDWEQDKEQLGCVMSGNYRSFDGKNVISSSDAERYIKDFAVPCAKKIIDAYLEGNVPEHNEVARGVLEVLSRGPAFAP